MTSFGRYELQGTLGEGGFATVYRAYDPALSRMVALKALHPRLMSDADIRRRFANEARLLARLHHPNIVTIYDVGEANGQPFFAMEFIEGETLANRVQRMGPLPLPEARRIVRELASSLDALHMAKLIHRDVKSANVMVETSGRIVLMDLGISRDIDATTHTASDISMGSPGYMAPEQVTGQPTSSATDIYALGVLAYELLAGRLPFMGDKFRVMYAHANEQAIPLHTLAPRVPSYVSQAIDLALSKEPQRRPSPARALAEMIAGDTQGTLDRIQDLSTKQLAPVGLLFWRSSPVRTRQRRRIQPHGALAG